MTRVVMKAKDNLNVWADYDTETQVYCDDLELIHIFRLKCAMYAKEHEGKNCSEHHVIDFIDTCKRLKDFHFDFTDEGIVYYRTKG